MTSMNSSCIFCKVIAGEAPAHKVYEDAHYVAFMDIYPITPGHLLVVPKQHVDYVFDLDDKTYAGAFAVVKKLSGPLQKATKCVRVCVIVEGYFVPHTHIHLVPTREAKDLKNATAPAKPAELETMAAKIKAYL